MTGNSDTGLGQKLIEEGAKEAVKVVVGPFAGYLVTIISSLGRSLIVYLIDSISENKESVSATHDPDSRGFVVIGLGRCGSRVTAQLANMIAEARGPSESAGVVRRSVQNGQVVGYFGSFFRRTPKTLRLEPTMVIGDLNEATFADVAGLMDTDADRKRMASEMLKIDYRPLAPNGAGNIPIFGEFFTRGLLSLPPNVQKDGRLNPWTLARTYLLERCTDSETNTRLAFYIFSAAGGSGAGAAAEIMRAQRFAIALSAKQPPPQLYFTGVAVIPDERTTRNDAQFRNTGRTIVQYLADLNIKLDSAGDYLREPTFQYGTQLVLAKDGERTPFPLQPWDSLGIVSNSVMAQASGIAIDQAKAESFANQYIAQQVFNLAAAQSPPGEFKGLDQAASAGTDASSVRFQALHLDKEDLRSGLRGPMCFAFSAASKDDVSSIAGVDALILRALSLPKLSTAYNQQGIPDLVQGISVAPLDPKRYSERTNALWKRVEEIRASKNSSKEELLEGEFAELARISLFKRCPRMIFVVTSPLDRAVSSEMSSRIADVLAWLMPNVKQARFAIVPGTTAFFSLSVYIESSVVLCYEVERAVLRYIWECWAQRTEESDVFQDEYEKVINQKERISDDQVENWLGKVELYGENVPDAENLAKAHNRHWQSFVDGANIDTARKAALKKHKVEDCFVTVQEVAAALRYINYVQRVEKRRGPVPRREE